MAWLMTNATFPETGSIMGDECEALPHCAKSVYQIWREAGTR